MTLSIIFRAYFARACVFLSLLGMASVHAAEIGVSDKEIIIGQSITLLGGKHAYGNAVMQGSKIVFDKVNAEGGVFGRKIIVRRLDDEGSSAKAEANARKLVADGAFLLFGSLEGGPSNAVLKVSSESKVPFFGPIAGSPTFRRPYQPYTFPVRAEHREEFRALMAWGKATGLKTVGFMHQDTEVGRAHVENVRLLADELGMQLTTLLPFNSDINDAGMDALVKELVRKKPDMVFNHGSAGPYASLLTKAWQAGVKAAFMGVNTGSNQIVEKLGDKAVGMVFAQIVPNPLERKHAISHEYQDAMQKAGLQSELSYGSLEGYMTAKLLVMGLRATGRDLTRTALIKTLESSRFDLNGIVVQYQPGNHQGGAFVDLAIVARDKRFMH